MDREERQRAWRLRMARRARSSVSVAAFCKCEGVSPASFYYWRRRLRAADGPQFVPVRVTSAVAVEVVLGNGRIVRMPAGTDVDWLRELFAAAEGSPC